MILSKLKIKGFKRIKSVDIDLADVTILVGPNGSGKSSIIQAVHLACCVMRQADRVALDRTSPVGIDTLDYLPTNDYKMLGHGTPWGNQEGTPCSEVTLTFDDNGIEEVARCTLRSARNAGISILGSVPKVLDPLLRDRTSYFTAYIPGISGVPNREEKRAPKVVHKACSFGDSNVILRNVLLLLRERSQQNISDLERWLTELIGPVQLDVRHDDAQDLEIACSARVDGASRPLELVGTGYLQLIQIFAYVLLFKPGILLIDEPDIHLHPTVQEKLVPALARVAAEANTRVLLTTHSPFVVRGAPPSARVYWVKDGGTSSKDRQDVERTLGWGASGKKVLIVSEDGDTTLLKILVGQWPEVEKFVAFYPGTGYKSLPKPSQAAELGHALVGTVKVLVHRDRDALTDDEVGVLEAAYAAQGVALWCTEPSDIEAYFCTAPAVAAVTGLSVADAQTTIDSVLARNIQPIRDQFDSRRAAHNEELHKSGGSPKTEDLWAEMASTPMKRAKGKYIFGQLKNAVTGGRFGIEAVVAQGVGAPIAKDLKTKLESLL